MNRREFLKAGAALAAALPLHAQETPPPPPVKSVIWLWMDGCPSQMETWDPKWGHGNSIETAVRGNRISERLPRCAEQMQRLSILRTVFHHGKDEEESTYLMHAGLYPSCWDVDVSAGTILAYELWKRDAGVPPFVSLDGPAIPESTTMGDLFLPVRLKGPEPDLVRRAGPAAAALLAAQDESWGGTRIQRAVRVHAGNRSVADACMNSRLNEALDLWKEPEDLRRAYGPGFGQQCLLARRLSQAGVAVIEVGLKGWDTTDDARRVALCGSLDAGLSTLVRDLAEKDLLRDTVVFCASAAGRTPWRAEGKAPAIRTQGFSVVMAGGRLTGGRVYGDTGEDGLPCNKPVPLWNLLATLYRACGIDYNKKYETNGRKAKYVSQNASVSTSGTPVKELF